MMEASAARTNQKPRAWRRRAMVALSASALMAGGLVVSPAATPAAEAAACGLHSYALKSTQWGQYQTFKVTNCWGPVRWKARVAWGVDGPCQYYARGQTRFHSMGTGIFGHGPRLVTC